MTDVNRGTTGVQLPAEVSAEIWAETLENSAIMRLARRIDLPGPGVTVQTITGEPEAEWVGETADKPVDSHTFGSKGITPYTLAVIEPFSNQFARDKKALYNELVRRLPLALAKKFDQTVFGPDSGKPGSNFDTLGGASAISITEDTWEKLVAAKTAIATGGGMLKGWALSPQAEALLLTAVDNNGRPLFINSMNTEGSVPALVGSPAHVSKAVYREGIAAVGETPAVPAQLGFAGDFENALYGVVEGVKIDISREATLGRGDNAINLFQQNMFAVRAEIEIGFRVKNIAEFVKLTA